LGWNSVTQIEATQINISHLDSNNTDVDVFLSLIKDKDSLVIQDRDDSNNFQKFTVNGTTTIFPNSYVEVPVTFATSSGIGTTNFSYGQHLALFIFSSGVLGPQGPTGNQGFTGPQGNTGIQGFTGPQGQTGNQGSSGPQGNTGIQGPTGPIGITIGSFGITLDGGNSSITSGSKGYVSMPYGGSITGWSIFANTSGDISIDLKKSTYTSFPTTNSIVGANYISLSSQQKNTDQTLSAWSVTFSNSDVYEFYVNSVSGVNKVNLIISTNKTS
jgi:hypothetical protein